MPSVKPVRAVTLVAVLAVTPLARPAFAQNLEATRPPASLTTWPLVVETSGAKLTVSQPDVEKWDGQRALLRAAVVVERPAAARPTYGTVWIAARTSVDAGQKLVTLDRFAAPRATFPGEPASTDAWLAAIRARIPQAAQTVALERFRAEFAATLAAERATAAVKNDPPQIFFGEHPSVLLLIDGTPALRPTQIGHLLRVVNTRRALILDQTTGLYYMPVGSRWLETSALDREWIFAPSVPDGSTEVVRAALAANEVALDDEDAPIDEAFAAGETPHVFVSTRPAELVQTKGDPSFVGVAGTDLLRLENADAPVLVDPNGHYFVLAGGRWFTATARNGPWSTVAAKDLPASFARIAPSDPTSVVLASVPGTTQAQEAAIANEVPLTRTIKKDERTLTPVIDGAPRVEPIDGTTVSYVVNATTPIVAVSGSYYACDDGVWYTAATPSGPFGVADSVPADIYTIPVTCPVHAVTYCRIYDARDGYVLVGYTPGYHGWCRTRDGCVVWGSGWSRRPWIGRRWIGRPWAYERRAWSGTVVRGGVRVFAPATTRRFVAATAPTRFWSTQRQVYRATTTRAAILPHERAWRHTARPQTFARPSPLVRSPVFHSRPAPTHHVVVTGGAHHGGGSGGTHHGGGGHHHR